MERLHCNKCGKEFLFSTGCSCCAPMPGPFRCPECGAVIEGAKRPYFVSPGWETD